MAFNLKHKYWIFALSLCMVLSGIFQGCKKKDNGNEQPPAILEADVVNFENRQDDIWVQTLIRNESSFEVSNVMVELKFYFSDTTTAEHTTIYQDTIAPSAMAEHYLNYMTDKKADSVKVTDVHL